MEEIDASEVPNALVQAHATISTMKNLLCLAAVAMALTTRAEKIALTNGTLINPATNQILPDATILIDGDHISSGID